MRTHTVVMLPRVIPLKTAPEYLGMGRNTFNRDVRPCLTEIPIGERGIGFDRLELDAWLDYHKECNGRRKHDGGQPWEENQQNWLDSTRMGAGSGTSTSASEVADFAKALESAMKKRPSKGRSHSSKNGDGN